MLVRSNLKFLVILLFRLKWDGWGGSRGGSGGSVEPLKW